MKLLTLLLTVALAFGLVACGGDPAAPESVPAAEAPESVLVSEEVSAVPEPEPPEPPEAPPAEEPEVPPEEASVAVPTEPEETPELPLASAEPVSGDLGEYHVTILGAEDFVTMEGEPGIRFYYDFTNNSDSPAIAWSVLSTEARQDDYELVTAYAEFAMDVPEYSNDSLRIQPGMTIRCVGEYNFKPLGGMLEFTVSDLLGGQTLTMCIDPDDLTGRPEPLEMPVIEEPDWMLGLSSDAELETCYVQFHGYELTTNLEGEPAIRVYYEYTNKREVPNAFFYDLNLIAFQDGVELQYSWMEETTEEEANTMVEIGQGETITVSSVYDLRSESPVEIYVEDIWEGILCGVAAPVKSYPGE